MRIKLAMLFTIAGLLVVGAAWFNRSPERSNRDLPAKETAEDFAVAQTPTSAEKSGEDWAVSIDKALKRGSDVQLETLFNTPNLPATAKAHLIDAALARQDARLLQVARELIGKMVRSGSAADVLAAIPKLVYFPDDATNDIASLQESLCRFQASPEDEFGFEMIKVKFAMVLGKEPSVKPWPAVCGAS